MQQRIKAIILSKKKYREYDELVWLYTEEYGIVSAIVHGIKRKRSKFKGELSLFSIIYVDIILKKGLSILVDFELIKQTIQDDNIYLTYSYAATMSELVRRIFSEKEPMSGLFRLLEQLLCLIRTMHHPELLLAYLQQKLLRYSGMYITLDKCVLCGETQHILGYSYQYHGLVCAKCQEHLVTTDLRYSGLLKLLIAFERLPVEKLASLVLEQTDITFICTFWNDIYVNELGITLKSQKVLTAMEKLKER